MVDLKKHDQEIKSIPDKIKEEEKSRYCYDCRFHEVLWMIFCVVMGAIVFPLMLVSFFGMSGNDANLFMLAWFLFGVFLAYNLYPRAIMNADKKYKDINYHFHIHI